MEIENYLTLSHSSCFENVSTFAIPYTLFANIIAEHDTEDKILFGCQFIQWLIDHLPDHSHAFFFAEKEVYMLCIHRLYDIIDA